MSFSVHNSTLLLCTSSSIISFSLKTSSLSTQTLPAPLSKDQKHNNSEIDSFHGITSLSISPDGTLFTVCTNRKQLCLYKTSDISLISNRALIRAASRVRFTPKNDIIVADKSGDAYLFSSDHPEAPGELILGHLSMLLDILVTEDNRYVITADRDEKIRVSHFPNSYEIQSFCLGHSAFVSSISLLPGDPSVLISAGGDGEFKFWSFQEGKELKSVSFMENIDKNQVKRLNDSLKDLELQESVDCLPVKHLRVQKSVLIASFYGSEVILVYGISGDLEVGFLQRILEDSEPLECLLSDGKLWVLRDEGVKVYKFEGVFVEDREVGEKLGKVNGLWKEMRGRGSKQMFYPILYKRKFDNVQEYQERKKSRMKLSD